MQLPDVWFLAHLQLTAAADQVLQVDDVARLGALYEGHLAETNGQSPLSLLTFHHNAEEDQAMSSALSPIRTTIPQEIILFIRPWHMVVVNFLPESCMIADCDTYLEYAGSRTCL